jgi:hypothetical protein
VTHRLIRLPRCGYGINLLQSLKGEVRPLVAWRIGWAVKCQGGGSHRVPARPGWPDFVFAFHDDEEIGARMPGLPSAPGYSPATCDRGVIVAREISEDLLLACSLLAGVQLFEYGLSLKPNQIRLDVGRGRTWDVEDSDFEAALERFAANMAQRHSHGTNFGRFSILTEPFREGSLFTDNELKAVPNLGKVEMLALWDTA